MIFYWLTTKGFILINTVHADAQPQIMIHIQKNNIFLYFSSHIHCKKIKYQPKSRLILSVQNKSSPSDWAQRVCCGACGNVRYIDVSNEQHWAPLIRWGWEWAVKSYQASQRPTFSPVQLKWERATTGAQGRASQTSNGKLCRGGAHSQAALMTSQR